MRYLIIKDNVVENAIEADEEFIRENYPEAIKTLEGDIGDIYDGFVFTKPEIKPVVPQIVTPKQIRLAMLDAGVLDIVETALENPSYRAEKLAWEYATSVERNDAMISAMAPVIGMTEEQIDQLFILAEQKI